MVSDKTTTSIIIFQGCYPRQVPAQHPSTHLLQAIAHVSMCVLIVWEQLEGNRVKDQCSLATRESWDAGTVAIVTVVSLMSVGIQRKFQETLIWSSAWRSFDLAQRGFLWEGLNQRPAVFGVCIQMSHRSS